MVLTRKTFASVLGLAFHPGRMEHSLVRAAKGRDRFAFDELRRQHERALVRFVARRVSEGDRDDVLQDTWIAAWENLPSFDGGSQFRSWVTSICYHKVKDYWRRELCQPPGGSLVDAEGHTAYLPREFAGVELREALRDFWETCTSDQREMLRMYYADGLTLKEIGQVLGRNLNTVKYQFYRAHEIAAQRIPTEEGPVTRRRLA